jgi:hypothetical protein
VSIVFADRGLHLAVLDALLTRGAIAPAALRTIVESAGGTSDAGEAGADGALRFGPGVGIVARVG